ERRLRRRADRQSRLEDERRDPRARPRLGRVVRPDHRDGHPRPARGGDRRPRRLPRRRPDRQGSGPAVEPRHRRDDGGGERTMKRVALKGLLGRKTRTILTGLAIVLGVAMISGTFVLTDTIRSAFDQIFKGSYENTAAVISGKSVVDFSNGGNATVSE